MSARWDAWGNPLNDEAQAEDDKNETVAMLTCPYYWAGKIESPMCTHGCWDEPVCHTNGPFKFPPDWPAERCLAVALDGHIAFQFQRPSLDDLVSRLS